MYKRCGMLSVSPDGIDGAREQALHVVHVVELRGPGVRDVDGHDLPVRLALVDQAQAAQHLRIDGDQR